MDPVITPLVTYLFSKGLSLLGNAVLAKGKDVIEEKLGIELKPDMSDEQVQSLKQKEMEHQEFLIEATIKAREIEVEAEKVGQVEVSKRWTADMSSDSWLSKNIRPSILIYLTIAYTVFVLLDGFISAFSPDSAYVTLLAELLKMVYAAYFVGRTVEKGIELAQVHRSNREVGK